MLDIILTDCLRSEPVTDAIRKKYVRGTNHLLVVPDRFTLSYERAVLEALGLKGTFDIEVSGMSRLADNAVTEKGCGSLNSLSEIMLLRKVIEQNRGRLGCFASSSAFGGFCSEFYAMLSQIRGSGVSGEMLESILPSLSGKTKSKTKDIVLLYGEYLKGLEGLKDNASKLELLTDVIKEGKYADTHVYISDFTGFTQLEYDVVEAFVKYAKSVTVCLPYSATARNSRIYPVNILNRLRTLASREGIAVREEVRTFLTGDFALARDYLFAYGGDVKKSCGNITLTCAAGRDSEIRQVARTIKEEVSSGRLRYRDCAVVCCNRDDYPGVVDKVFADFSIPVYFDVKSALAATAGARLMLGGIRTVLKKYRMRETLEFAKCLLSGVSPSDSDALENYCLRYYIDYSLFRKPFDIRGEGFEEAERARKRIAWLLQPLDIFEGSATAGEFTSAVTDFMNRCDFINSLQRLAERQKEAGLEAEAMVSDQCATKLADILNECSAVFGQDKISGELYYEVIASAIGAQEISTVPLSLDCVYVGQAGESRYENCKYMFIVGASAGYLPHESADTGMITDKECSAWREHGADVRPGAAERNLAYKLSALMTIVKPSDKLRISYSISGKDGERLQPSAAMRELSVLLGKEIEYIAETPALITDNGELARYLGGSGNAKGAFITFARLRRMNVNVLSRQQLNALYGYVCGKYGREYIDGIVRDEEGSYYAGDAGRSVYGRGEISASKLEKYMKCPFMYYMDYVLRVKEREEARMNVRDTGSLVHEIMEKFFTKVQDFALSRDEIEKITDGIMAEILQRDEYAYLAGMTHMRAEIRRIRDRSVFGLVRLCDKMNTTRFRPYRLEAEFGRNAAYPPVEIRGSGGTLRLIGKIDRIDKCGDRIAVIDYKSSASVEFTPLQLIRGERIQTFIYMCAALSDKSLRPAGVFYLPLGGGYSQEGKNDDARLKYSGFTCSDTGVLDDMDTEAAQGVRASRLYPFKVKNGKVSADIGSCVASDDEFAYYCDYAKKISAVAADEISEGFMDPSPAENVCGYCAYSSLCAHRNENVRKDSDYGLPCPGNTEDTDGVE